MRTTRLLFLVAALVLFTITMPASAEEEISGGQRPPGETLTGDSEGMRGEVLEAEINALKRELEQIRALGGNLEVIEKKLEEIEIIARAAEKREALLKEEKKIPLVAYYKDDFWLETPDKEFQLRVRGNIHFDTRFFDGESGAPNSFDIRRARYDLQGFLYKYYSFRLQAEMADAPYLRNAWVEVGYVSWLRLRLGQMKPPFSTLWWTLDNRLNFVERATSTPLYPFFDRGFWLWGELFGKTLTWNASVWTGAGLDLDARKGDIDDHKDIIGRIFWSPFKNTGNPLLEGFHVCVQGTHAAQSVPTDRFEKSLRTPNYNSCYWSWKDKTMFIGRRERYGAEFHWLQGPFVLSSEWICLLYQDMNDWEETFHGVDGKITSFTVWTSYFLTGESKEVDNFGWRQPKPKKNFDPIRGTWGGWDILARYSHTETDERFFDLGILNGASWADEYTIGVNWLLNPMITVQLNNIYIRANGLLSGYDSDQWNPEEKGKKRDTENAVFMRLIFKI